MTVVELDGRIVDRRHRADVPDGRDARDRPRAARLLLPARPRRRHRGDRAHPRPRGPRRRAALRPARDRHPAGDLRRPADDRHGPLEARGAQAPGRAAAGPARPGKIEQAGPFGIEMVHMSHSIPDARAVALHTDLGPVLFTGDYKFDQTPVDGQPGRLRPPRRARPRGAALPLRRLDQRRPPRRRALGVERRPGAAGDVRALRGPDHRHLLRLQRPPRPAGDRRRRAARPQGRARRPLDAQELQHRLQPRDRERARRPAYPAARDRGLPRREGDRDLDRQPGRAALGAAADGARRPSRRRAALGRHRRLLGDADARQRALGQRDGRPDLRDRRPGDHRRRRPDPRLRPRLPGGA